MLMVFIKGGSCTNLLAVNIVLPTCCENIKLNFPMNVPMNILALTRLRDVVRPTFSRTFQEKTGKERI